MPAGNGVLACSFRVSTTQDHASGFWKVSHATLTHSCNSLANAKAMAKLYVIDKKFLAANVMMPDVSTQDLLKHAKTEHLVVNKRTLYRAVEDSKDDFLGDLTQDYECVFACLSLSFLNHVLAGSCMTLRQSGSWLEISPAFGIIQRIAALSTIVLHGALLEQLRP